MSASTSKWQRNLNSPCDFKLGSSALGRREPELAAMSVASIKARSKSRCQRGAPTRASGTWPLRAGKSGSDSPLGDSKPLQLSAGLAGVRPRASDPAAGTDPNYKLKLKPRQAGIATPVAGPVCRRMTDDAGPEPTGDSRRPRGPP